MFRTCCREPEVKEKLLRKVHLYIQKAVHICWLMQTQQPAMHVNRHTVFSATTRRDSALYDSFGGHFGDIVKDLVLPELYFFEDGMVAAKGIVRVEDTQDTEMIPVIDL